MTARKPTKPGTVDLKPPRNASFEDRLLPVTETGCWLFLGATNDRGYGQVRVNGILEYAHRYSYSRSTRPLRQDEILLHICDTPLCCNPAHLRPGTMAENTQDMIAKKRDRLVGERSPRAKITRSQAVAIRASKLNTPALARKYLLSPTHVNAIRSGRYWRSE